MKQIVNVTNNPKQIITLQNENGEDIELYLEYKPRVQNWFYSLKYNDLEIKNLQVCIHPNILRQFKRNINFGIGFLATNKAEPFSIDSFLTEKCKMYLLNAQDVIEIEQEVYNEQMGI